MPWVAVGAAALGAVAGSQKDKSDASSSTTTQMQLRDFNSLNVGRSDLEAQAYDQSKSTFTDLSSMVNQGPGSAEITANNTYQNSFANTLQGMLAQISNPTAASQQANFSQAQQMFAPQQTALNQQFQDASRSSDRLSARLGRAGNDPILRNKLMQEQTRQQTTLNSQIGAYGQQLPYIRAQQTADIGGQLSNLRAGLATQAMQNRQMLMGVGQSLTAAERNYRMGTATKTSDSNEDMSSGGGLKGAIQGGMAGLGAGMSAMKGMGGK